MQLILLHSASNLLVFRLIFEYLSYQPVSSPPLEDMESSTVDINTDELGGQSCSSQLPPPGPQEIIDLSESHSFIVTEVPPENVMEGDGEETDEVPSTENKT